MMKYAFAQKMIPLIQAGAINATFRPPNQRHARPGERIRLTDRTSFSPIIPDPICTDRLRCEISWVAGRIDAIRLDGVPVVWFERFAASLGYQDFSILESEWRAEYGPTFLEGSIIEWQPPVALAAGAAA